MTDMTTRRAIEICLSRLPLHGPARDALARSLSSEISRASDAPTSDVDTMRALFEVVLSDASGIDTSFSKAAMLSRFSMIRETARKATSQVDA